MSNSVLAETARALVAGNKGILASDSSPESIEKRFEKVDIENTEENRRNFRQLFITTDGMEQYISGVIMHDETFRQSADDGRKFVEILESKGVLPGIKVDQGKEPLPNSPQEFNTKGMWGLSERLAEYKQLGAKFAKWRGVIVIGKDLPTDEAINSNADLLSDYALACQENNIVPIVEPEVLMDGGHSIEKCREVTFKTLKKVFLYLSKKNVNFEAMLLKPNMVLSGKNNKRKDAPANVAQATMDILLETLPDTLAGVVFLSGGQSATQATENLNAINKLSQNLWPLSFSFERALQEPSLEIWKGEQKNLIAAQKEFLKRAKLNSLATLGKYEQIMEGEK